MKERDQFQFILDRDDWMKVRPQSTKSGKEARNFRRLVAPRADILSSETNETHKGCVLRPKYQHARSSMRRKVNTQQTNRCIS